MADSDGPDTGGEQTATDSIDGADMAPQTDPGAEAAKWKSLARKHEQQAKANADAARRLAEIEESQKSEQQRLTERADAAERRAAAAELGLLRADVAAAKGVPAALASRLTGSTREDLEADADLLLQTIRPADDPRPQQGVPAAAVAGTSQGNGKPREARDIFASLMKGG